jgi:hypothetical protein
MGASSFILSTDQGLLRKAAGQILNDFREPGISSQPRGTTHV